MTGQAMGDFSKFPQGTVTTTGISIYLLLEEKAHLPVVQMLKNVLANLLVWALLISFCLATWSGVIAFLRRAL